MGSYLESRCKHRIRASCLYVPGGPMKRTRTMRVPQSAGLTNGRLQFSTVAGAPPVSAKGEVVIGHLVPSSNIGEY